jgi:hypothetical protein
MEIHYLKKDVRDIRGDFLNIQGRIFELDMDIRRRIHDIERRRMTRVMNYFVGACLGMTIGLVLC